MADVIVVSNNSSVKSSINPNNSEVLHCKKCKEVEYHLQQALEELISAQLIIQMLKEESLQDQQRDHRTIESINLIHCNQQGTVETNENKWSKEIPSHNRRLKQVNSYPNVQQIITQNRFQVLEQFRDYSESGDGQKPKKLRSVPHVIRKKTGNKCHKIILIGDSHARECAQKLSNYLDNYYEVIGYVSPGAGLEVITNLANKELDHLSQEDLVVVCGGANNISKNNSMKGLSCVTKFIQHRRHMNVLLINAPHRYDLEESSCVNKEVKIFNRKLSHLVKKYYHADVIALGKKKGTIHKAWAPYEQEG